MKTDDLQELYRILDLKSDATTEDLKRSYRDLVKVWHPDRFTHDSALLHKAQEKLKEINSAYELLGKLLAEKKEKPSPKQNEKLNLKDLYLMGVLFMAGDGVKQDSVKAVSLLRQAADGGYAPAQYLLGLAYFSGDGVIKSVGDAALWWIKAAEQLDAEAQYSLGNLYHQGHKEGFIEKVVKHTTGLHVGDAQVEAYKWLNLAMTYGIGRKGLSVKQDVLRLLSQQQLNEAMRRAAVLYPKYTKRNSHHIFDELFNLFIQESNSSGNLGLRNYVSKVQSKVGNLENIRIGIREKALEILHTKVFGNVGNKTTGFFKEAGSFWSLHRSQEDWERIIARGLVSLDYEHLPLPESFLQKRENAINQIWINLSHQ